MSTARWFNLDDPAALEPSRAGGKAAGLAALRRYGLRTPPGWILPPEADAADAEALAAHLASSPAASPGLLAVRSSAVGEDAASRSHAGVFRTRLGVRPSALREAVLDCRASASAPAATAYRHRHGDPPVLPMAVLVQPLVDADVSGVAFGADPLTGEQDVVVVEAVIGLGEPLVSGRVDPHRWRLRRCREGWTTLRHERGLQRTATRVRDAGVIEEPVAASGSPLLDEPALAALADAVLRAAAARGGPQDVEWAIDAHGLVLLQSRPITARAVARSAPDVASAPPPGILWTRANFREVLPELPSPALLSIWRDVEEAMEHYYREVGLPPDPPGRLSRCIRGRLYFNATAMASIYERLGLSRSHVGLAIGHGLPLTADGGTGGLRWRRLIRHAIPALRLAWRQAGAGRAVRRYTTMTRRLMARAGTGGREPSCERAFLDLLANGPAAADAFIRAVSAVAGGYMSAYVRISLLTRGGAGPVEGFIGRMTAPGTKTVSTQQGIDLLGLTQQAAAEPVTRCYLLAAAPPYADHPTRLAGTTFLREFARFIERYGHRAIHESDPAQPRFREDPSYLLASIAESLRGGDPPDPDALERSRVSDARAAWASFTSRLGLADRLIPWRVVVLRMALSDLKRFSRLREEVRFESARATEAMRNLQLALGRRWVGEGRLSEAEDIFLLSAAEVARALRETGFADTIPERVGTRRRERAVLLRETLPNLMEEATDGTLRPVLPDGDHDVTVLRGLAVSGGRAQGPAAIVHTPAEFARMRAGSILVAPVTDPAWSPLFALARGVVVEMGGLLSHGSILAREYGIPTVVNVPGVCDALHDGEWIEVDGWQGVVRRGVPPTPLPGRKSLAITP